MSIPYRPRKAVGDVGPCYYSPNSTSDTKVRLSASKMGSSCMNSAVDRFPLRHAYWGMPEPGHYEPLESLHSLQRTCMARNTDLYSSAFLTTTRDNYFYNMSFSMTPGPGTYNSNASIRKNQLLQTRRKYEKLKEKSQVYYLIVEAAKAYKSLARYQIENDENYVPPKPYMQEETLPRRPLTITPETKVKCGGLERVYQAQEMQGLKQKYYIYTEQPEKLLASEIYAEIDETARHYEELNGKPEVQRAICYKELKELVYTHLRRVDFENYGLAFGTRKTSYMVDEVKTAEEEQNAMLGPGRYEAPILLGSRHADVVPIKKQLGRLENVVNDGKKTYYIVGQDAVPPVGSYDVRETRAKSFLLNEDNKWI